MSNSMSSVSKESSPELPQNIETSTEIIEVTAHTENSNVSAENEDTKKDCSEAAQVVNSSYDFVSPPWKSCWDSNYNCYYYWNTETNETTYNYPGAEAPKTAENPEKYNQTEASGAIQASTQLANSAYYPQDASNYYYPQQPGATLATVPMNYYPSYAGLYNAPAPVQHSTEDPEYSDFIKKEYGLTTITSEGKIGGMFNAKTGNFQSDSDVTPDKFSQYNKAVRQCNAFFDYDSFAEQRGLQYMAYYNGLTPNPRHQKLPKKVFEKLKTLKKEKKLESKKKWLRD